jgi:hypothetical protein
MKVKATHDPAFLTWLPDVMLGKKIKPSVREKISLKMVV